MPLRILISITVSLFTILLTTSQGGFRAETFKPQLVRTEYGAKLIFNGTRHTFSIRFESPDIKPTEKPNFIIMDNQLIQTNLIPFQKDFGFDSLSINKQKELLNRYKEFEKKHVEKALSMKLKEREAFAVFNRKLFKSWLYQMPPKNPSVARQVYFMTICFDQILVISAPVAKGENDRTVINLLENIAQTLEFQ